MEHSLSWNDSNNLSIHQARHDKYMSEGDFILPANKRMAFLVDCVEAFKSEMLEVSSWIEPHQPI